MDHTYGPGKTRGAWMLKSIKVEWNNKQTSEQIRRVEDHYDTISRMTFKRKKELMSIPDPFAWQESPSEPNQQSYLPTVAALKDPKSQSSQNATVPQPNLNTTTTPKSNQSLSPTPQLPDLLNPFGEQNLIQSIQDNQFSRQLVLLDKIYKEEDKFGGTGDNFDFKVTVYYDKCRRADLPSHAYIYSASIMLTGQALTRFYANRIGTSIFEQFCHNMRNFFEGTEWQRFNLTKWQTYTFSAIISYNPTLSATEYLCKLCTELDKIKQGLDPAYYGPVHLRENIIWACRGHPALVNGLTSLSADASGLVNRLYTSIVNYEAIHNPSGQQSYTQSHEEDHDTYFTDRQYRRGRPSSRPNQPYNTRQGSYQRRKRCFLCGKEGCWSTSHSQQERDESKKQFTNKHSKYKSCKRYDRHLQQYITHQEVKDIDADCTDDVAQFFEELSVDVGTADKDSDFNLTSESSTEPFFTYFGTFQNTESMAIVSLLANTAFKHQITFEDDISAHAKLEPYSFNISTSSQYNNSEFKELLIDSGAATRCTGGISQFEALQTIDNSIMLDKGTAGSTSFIFGIGSTLSIGIVNLNTPIEPVVFYIVQSNIPFLLCLADMDKLKVFFNNITNKLIQPGRTLSHPVICRYGHAFSPSFTSAYSLVTESIYQNPCFLTDVEL